MYPKEGSITVCSPVDPIVIGKLGGAYGVKGWIKVISFTDKTDNIFNYNPWLIFFKERWTLIRLECWKLTKKQCYIAKIFGIANREIAMSLTNCSLVINSSQLPLLCNNEYYWKDIIGCKVVTVYGNNLGCVDYIIETTAYDILVLDVFDKNVIKIKNYFIPFVQDKIIKRVDLKENVVVVDWDNNF